MEETGGIKGIIDMNNLNMIAARPLTSFGGQNLFPGLFLKAAAYGEGIATLHPFADGNKRTAYAAAGMFLRLNGYHLKEKEEAEQVMVDVATRNITIQEFAEWLDHNAEKQ